MRIYLHLNEMLTMCILCFTVLSYYGPVNGHVLVNYVKSEGVRLRRHVLIHSAEQETQFISVLTTAHRPTGWDQDGCVIVGFPQSDLQRGCRKHPISICEEISWLLL